MAFRGLKRQTSAGTKKLTFKGFVVPSKPAVTQFDEARWSTLSAAVSSILDKTPFSQNNEAVYKLAERMSSQGMAPTMYQRLKEQLRAHQVRVTEQLLGEDTPNHVAALVHMDRAWQTLCEQTVGFLFRAASQVAIAVAAADSSAAPLDSQVGHVLPRCRPLFGACS